MTGNAAERQAGIAIPDWCFCGSGLILLIAAGVEWYMQIFKPQGDYRQKFMPQLIFRKKKCSWAWVVCSQPPAGYC